VEEERCLPGAGSVRAVGQGRGSGARYRAGCLAALVLLGLFATVPRPAQADPIGSGALKIQGNRLTLYADALTNDADQTINVGERARIRTCFGAAEAACGSVFPGDPRVAGMLVRAELSGPEVPQPIPVETVPGGTFLLPGFQQEGDYRLENIRLVDEATGQVLSTSEPSLAILHVREILLASASVRTLSLQELRDRGITLTAENFQAFNFSVGFAFGSEIVEIELPMLYSGYGTVEPLARPTVNLDGLPPDVAHAVERWQPPQIVPFRLEQPEAEQGLRAGEEEDEALRLPLFGAIVLPGTVSYLNQFFEARLVVANGAPVGSNASLEDIQATLRLPPYNVLRIAASQPSVAPGQSVPVVSASGSRALFPGQQGSAAWTVEGLAAGTHTLQIDVNASLERPGRDPFPLLTRIQAAIEVVDARFNLTFSHPDVVREGEEYTLFVTVTNLSRAAQNLVSVDLDETAMTGAHRADPADNLKRTIQTLAPGQAETLEYRLVADLDGKVVATTFQSTSSAGQGTIRLRTGVGELGIPLSPATLVLPRFSERLKRPFLPDDELHRAHTRFLGLAYSLAVAPAAMTPAGLPRVIKSDVERRAVDFAHAGMRTFLQEPLLESLEVLALDYLGNRHPLAEIDELRRGTGKGLAVGTELAKVIQAQQAQRGFDAEELFDHFAATTTYTDPYVAALLVPDAGDVLDLEVQGSYEGVFGTLAAAARTLAFGELFPVRRVAGSAGTVPFALVGHVTLGQELQAVVRNPGTSAARGTLLLIVPGPDGTEDVRYEVSGLDVPPGGAVAVRIGSAIGDPRPVVLATGAPAAGFVSSDDVRRPPFRLIGAVQDFRIKEDGPDELGNMIRPNRYGNGLLYLFNRPPAKAGAEDPETWAIRSTFQGLDTAGQPASGTSEKVGTGAWLQDDGRTVSVRYATPLSALINPATGQPLLAHQHLLDTNALRDAWGEPLGGTVAPPTVEVLPDHVGGLVGGRVVRGTGEPVAGATVQLIRPIQWETRVDTVVKLDFLGEVVTGADGTYFFDFVENPSWDKQVEPGFVLRAIIPAGHDPALEPEERQEVGSTIRLQNRMARINIALLGRGTLTGRAVYGDDFSPVGQGTVRAASTLFNEEKTVVLKADGTFTVPGMPVGPITLVVEDRDGRVGYATVGIDRAGATVEALVEVPRIIPGKGTVAGRVVGATTGDAIAGARVAVYSKGAQLDVQETDDFGRFRFDGVPEGQVSLQAANWAVSRVAIFTDLTLAAGETKEMTLRLPQGASRAVAGAVYFHDPVSNTNVPVQGAVAFVEGPGVFAYTDAFGRYRIEGVPVQGANESYRVKAIDFGRKLEGSVGLPPVLDVSPDVIDAQSIVLQQMNGGIDGVVLDPLGRPLAGAEVVLYPYGTTTSGPTGGFSFANVPLGSHSLVAHVGDGLQAGKVGWFGDAAAQVLYGGHRPFVQVRMRGAGVVNILTRTQSSTGVLTPIYYKPTWYSAVEYRIRVKGAYTETSTDPNGNLQIVVPVGSYEIVAYNPFHGMHTITGEVRYAGQIVDHEVVFENAATVSGQVVNVDGVTPVPGVEVVMEASGLAGQKLRTDPDGRFRFELVPMGRVLVTAQGLAGSVERVGRTLGYVGTAGQELELVVQMKAQGTVTGRVVDVLNGVERPLANAHYFLQEDTFPFRRIPAEGWRVADGNGRYQVPHVYAGGVTVVARDSGQVSRQGSARSALSGDWQVLEMPVIAMVTNVGSMQVTVRDPVSGGPVADAQVRLSNADMTVTGPDGIAFFDALPLGTYTVYAFYAPSGQSGRLTSVALTSAGQQVFRTVYLDQRGEVRGTLWDDAAKTKPMPGGTVRLTGETAGGRVTALATTSSQADKLGKFEMLGIPEGSFQLEAAAPTSPRRAFASAALTATSPIVVLDMVLEASGDLYFRLFEKLKAGTTAINLSGGLFSLRLTQQGYDYAQLAPDGGTDRFKFPGVLLARSGNLGAEELTGERRTAGAAFSNFTSPAPVGGAGTSADPYKVVLSPKGTVRVWVRDGAGRAAPGANVTLSTSRGQFPSVTGADGSVSFAAVPSGGLSATATSLSTGTGGSATATLTYDDELIEMNIALAPAVSARGLIYLPVPNDNWNGDPALLVPAPGIIVELRDSKNKTQVVLTDEQGSYRFGALPTGGYTLTARNGNGDQLATRGGTLVGPDGNENVIPALILDASPPRLLTISPPPGFEGVSRTAAVELVFSEPLDPAVLPVNQGNPAPYFSLRAASGAWAQGAWSSSVDAEARQVVRFVPSVQYENSAFYSLSVLGGPGGVRDRMLRPLTASGNVGSNFKTSDSVGPSVIRTEPDLARPVDPAAPVRFDFSEALKATDEQLDGDLSGDAVELSWQRDVGTGAEWRRLPVATYLTRSSFSLAMQAAEGVSLEGDTLQRKVVISGLKDSYGNVMPVYTAFFRVYDKRAPRLDAVPFPPGSLAGQLLQGQKYTLTPLVSQLDDVTPANPGGDVDRVDYFFADPTDPQRPVSPSYSSRKHPFAYGFVGAYSGNGVDPRPFPVWVRAVDTSTNQSNVVRLDMMVLPNNKPSVEVVSADASSPVPGTVYPGSKIAATASGFSDLDGFQLTVFTQLWQEGAATFMAESARRNVMRPVKGWYDAASEAFDFQLPLTIPEGTVLFVRALVIDSDGAVGTVETARFTVNDDDQAPVIDDFSVRLAGAPVTHLFIGEEFYIELKARDVETAIQAITLRLDRTDLFPQALSAMLVAGTKDLYRTGTLTVPTGITGPVPIAASVEITDFGGNLRQSTAQFNIGPERDPAAPVARWISPWQGALWPAGYTSTVSPQGAAVLLRLYARDTNLDGEGNPVPGKLVSVGVRGPQRDAATGELGLPGTWTSAVKVAGTEDLAGAVYQAMWRVPNGIPAGTEVPFEVRLIDSAGTETITRATMTAVAGRQAYEAALTAVGTADPMLRDGWNPDGPVFLLDGTTLSILPQTDGTVRSLPALFLYTGGSTETGALVVRPTVLTAPEITTYDSAILYHPLELAIGLELGVAAESRIDTTRRGLLGSKLVSGTIRSMVLPGETGAAARAGGSHGGRGWFGSGGTLPGSVHDSLRDPRLPGGGGGTVDANAGGTGGGVIRLLAGDARVHVDGSIVTNGGDGAGTGGGGAGGAVRLAAGRLEGRGRIEARGGAGPSVSSSGGGGGGRVSITWRELAASFNLATQVDASGGLNSLSAASADRRGGAGTVYLEAVDAETGVAGPGRLLLQNPLEPVRAALTPLPALGSGTVTSIDPATAKVVLGVASVRGNLVGDKLVLLAADGTELGRFPIAEQARVSGAVQLTLAATPEELAPAAGAVSFRGESRLLLAEAEGTVRWYADDDLLLGPEGATALNDRAAVILRRGARALLANEAPVVTYTATPVPGTEVLLGSTIKVEWAVSDLFGLDQTRIEPFGATPAVTAITDERLTEKSPAATTMTVPITNAAASYSFTVEARNQAGRVTRPPAVWPVPANQAPTGQVALAAGTQTPVRSGAPFNVTVHAEDRERLLRVTLLVTGPATPASQSTTVTGTSADVPFTVQVAASASQPIVLQALIEDASGGSTTTAALSVPVAANGMPPVATLALSPDLGATGIYRPGQVVQVTASATDDVGVTGLSLVVNGVTTSSAGTPIVYSWTVPNVTGSTAFTLQATATDGGGNQGTATRTVNAAPVPANPLPTAAFTCPTAGATLPTDYTLPLNAAAADDTGVTLVRFYLGDAATPFASVTPTGAPKTADVSTSFNLATVTGPTVRFRVEAVDTLGQTASQEIEIQLAQVVNLKADGQGTNDWAALTNQVVALRSGTLTINQPVTLGGLLVLGGAKVTHPAAASSTSPGRLELSVVGPVYVGCGSEIDASQKGYLGNVTYPDHTAAGFDTGGSHMGEGGVVGTPAAETFGSVYFPRENGGGGRFANPAGGAVRLTAGRVQIDGKIRANGGWLNNGSAGGSVWITAGVLAGGGTIEAKGGETLAMPRGNGGGGAIAVEYGALAAGSTLLDKLVATGGPKTTEGGAGTVYVRGAGETYGALTIDNGAVTGKRTILPALGKGMAQPGSFGATLATGRSRAIPAYFVGHWVEVRNGATGALEGTWRVTAIGADGFTVTLAANAGEPVTVDPGDLWQGVYRFDRYTAKGDVVVVSDDPIRILGELVVSGKVETTAVYADRLVVKAGGSLRQLSTAGAPSAQSLRIEVGDLVVEPGGEISVSSRGYGPATTYPPHDAATGESGGSHIGEGGPRNGQTGETYGSVYFPQENGGGGGFGAKGGGAVRVIAARRAQIDGAIRANGESNNRGGAGGSIWITTPVLAGGGTVEARGGNSTDLRYGSGGGGAVSAEYGTLEPGSALNLTAAGGTYGEVPGGAGSVYTRSAGETYGSLTIDKSAVTGGRKTVLPALGKGVAQPGSIGAALVTGRPEPIPAYFVGHWVEVRDGATGVLEGTWRIASIAPDNQTVILAANAGEPVTVGEGDLWQGVYVLDRYTVKGDVMVVSDDPIRVRGEQVVAGTVETDRITADRLVVKTNAILTQRYSSQAVPESLSIEVGELVVETGGFVSVSTRGYPATETYPGHTATTSANSNASGGSHIGQGGPGAQVGETYGSVTRPQENGAGAAFTARGGGALRIVASRRVQIDGAVRANGESNGRGGAGGSIWITTDVLAGRGAVEAKGASSTQSNFGSGGGGAIAIEYGTLEAGSTLLGSVVAYGGTYGITGGAGSIHLRTAGQRFGTLTLDNGTVTDSRNTILPALGKGTAQAGSAGDVLVTGRAKAVPAYFAGHWVEVRDGATGAQEGMWRIASISADGFTVTLASNEGEPVTVDPGDTWQGTYRFDGYTVRGSVRVFSDDPIRVHATQVVEGGTFETDKVYADRLVVKPGAILTQRFPIQGTPGSLYIEAGEVVVEAGGFIGVSTRGYAVNATYPGHVGGSSESGASHMGQGGADPTPGETYGSVTRPQENGAGAMFLARGGGAVRIVTNRLQVDGEIRANGESSGRGGAGGSLWITANVLAGDGRIEARGGDATQSNWSSGGGGAIAIEYNSVEGSSTILDHLFTYGGSYGEVPGGAGTLYLRGPGANLGALTVDNKAVPGKRLTILPSLSQGIVQAGSSGGTILTGRAADVPAYFVGHWVEVEGPDRFVKGIWRIAAVSGTAVTLEPRAAQPFNIVPGDRWRGVYRFDSVTIASSSVLVSNDKLVQLVPPLPAESRSGPRSLAAADYESLYGNDQAPAWEKSAVSIAVGTVPGSYRITLAPNALSDPDGVSEVQLTSGGRSMGAPWTPEGVSFLWSGRPGQQLHLVATDAHERFRRSGWLELPALPGGGWAPQLVLARGVTPLAVTGGADWLAVGDDGVWLYGAGTQPVSTVPPRTPADEVVALAASGDLLFAATRDRIDLLDRNAETVREVPVSGMVLDVLADAGGATVLLADPVEPALRLARLDGAEEPVLTAAEGTLPLLSEPALQRTPGYLHLFGLEADGKGVIHTWTGGSPAGAPEVWEVAEGWTGVGAWEGGALLLDAAGVRLVAHGAEGWTEVSRIDLPAEPWSAAVAGGALVVLLPGEVRVYDVSDAAAPVLTATHPGSSHRSVEPLTDGEVLLWSPRMAVPPLRWAPAAALPGDGFTTVIDGLP